MKDGRHLHFPALSIKEELKSREDLWKKLITSVIRLEVILEEEYPKIKALVGYLD